MFLGRIAIAFLVAATGVWSSGSGALAQSGSEGIAEIRALEAQLHDPSPIIRLVTLQDALASGKPLIRKFALQIAYAEGDPDMKEVALRNSLELERKYILSFQEKTEPKYKEWRERQIGSTLELRRLDKSTGQFSGVFGGTSVSGRILRDGLEFSTGNCTGRFLIADRTFMQGPLECENRPTLIMTLPLE